MNSNLKHRFLLQKIEDLKNDCLPYPTILCDMKRIDIIEIVRKNVMFCKEMVPFTSKYFVPEVKEGLELVRKSVDYGELYILVNRS